MRIDRFELDRGALNAAMLRQGIGTFTELALKARINHATVSVAFKKGIARSILIKLAKALNVSPFDLIIKKEAQHETD